MANPDFLFTADIENEKAKQSIDELTERAKQFEKRGTTAFQEYAEKVRNTVDELTALRKMFNNITKSGTATEDQIDALNAKLLEMFDKPIKNSIQFRAAVDKLFKDIVAQGEQLNLDKILDFGELLGPGYGGKLKLDFIIELLGKEEVDRAMDDLRNRTQQLLESSDKDLRSTGIKLRSLGEEYYDSFKKGGEGIDETLKKLNQLIKDTRNASKELDSLATEVSEPLTELNIEQRLSLLAEQASGFLNSADEEVQDFGERSVASLERIAEYWAKHPDEIAIVSRAINGVSRNMNEYRRGVEASTKSLEELRKAQEEEVRTEALEPLKVDVALEQLQELRDRATEYLDSASEEGKRFGRDLTEALDNIEAAWSAQELSVDAFSSDLKAVNTQVNLFAKRVDSLTEEEVQFDEILNLKQTEASLHRLDEIIEDLLASTNQEAVSAGEFFTTLRDRIRDALVDPQADAEELRGRTERITREADNLARAYGENVPRGADRAIVSVWKLGHALDRVGVRGAGGALRIADAFGKVPVMATVAIAAIAGIALGIKKLIDVVVQLEKAMIKAFVDTIKKAVEVSKDFEIVERQLENVFNGEVAVARRTFDKILDLSVKFGTDLTQEFTQIFLPLVDGFDQLEKLAEFVSTLKSEFGTTSEQAARSLAQGIAGQWQSLQRQYKLLGSDVERIKELQEELGDVEGFIVGMEEYFRRTGQQWDTYEDTLQRVLGSFELLRKKALLALGEPIKNEIVVQLRRILDWIEENEDKIRLFLERVGKIIADVFGTLGDVIGGALESIDTADIAAIQLAFEQLAEVVNHILEGLGSFGEGPDKQLNFLVRVVITLLKTLEATLRVLDWIIDRIEEIDAILNPDFSNLNPLSLPNWTGTLGAQADYKKLVDEIAEGIFTALEDVEDLTTENILKAMEEYLTLPGGKLKWLNEDQIAATIEVLRVLGLTSKEAKDALKELGYDTNFYGEEVGDLIAELEAELLAIENNSEALDARANAILENKKQLRELAEIQQEWTDATKEMTEAERELQDEMRKRFMGIFAESMIGDIDAAIEQVGERIRIEQQKIANLESIQWVVDNTDLYDIDTGVQNSIANINALQGEIDAIFEDIAGRREKISEEELRRLQMEIDFKRRLIKLEQDHIDALEDLRTQRAQDERDALIDRNDREADIIMDYQRDLVELELDHSRKIEQMERAHQNRLREIRARADFDAQEAIRMNDAVELLRIRRRMELDLQLERDRHQEQRQSAEEDAADRRAELKRQLDYELEDLEIAHGRKLRDIEQNFRDQMALIEENYQRQLRDQALYEKQKREDLIIWLQDELQDFSDAWDEKNALLKDKYEEYYKIHKRYLDMVQDLINSRDPHFLAWASPGNIGGAPPGVYGPFIPYMPPAGQGYFTGGPYQPSVPPGPFGGSGTPTGGSGGGGGVSQSLVTAVMNLLYRLVNRGLISQAEEDNWIAQIQSATSNARLREIENQLRIIGVGSPMQHGGLVNQGQRYVVGEQGPEPFRPTRAGILEPARKEYMPTGSPLIQNVSADNSRNVSASISLLDPTHFTPIQMTIIRSIVTEEILKSVV